VAAACSRSVTTNEERRLVTRRAVNLRDSIWREPGARTETQSGRLGCLERRPLRRSALRELPPTPQTERCPLCWVLSAVPSSPERERRPRRHTARGISISSIGVSSICSVVVGHAHRYWRAETSCARMKSRSWRVSLSASWRAYSAEKLASQPSDGSRWSRK